MITPGSNEDSPARWRRGLYQAVFSAVLFLGILALVVLYWEALRTQAASVNLYWLVAGAGCYACNYLTRACRLWLFSRKEVPLFPTTFKITCLHGINTYFFPFRTGELTLPLLYKAYAETGYSLGLRFLVRARLLDFAGLGILVIVSSSLLTSRLPPELKTVFLMLGLGFVMIPYAAVYCLRLDTPMIKKWREKAIGLRLPAYPNFQEITVSLLIWLWIGGTIFCVARSLNLPLSFFDVLFLVTFQLPLQIIPVQGIANAGNHEAAWLGALALLGVKREVIVPLALSSHVVLIGYVLVLGLVASLLPAGNRRRT